MTAPTKKKIKKETVVKEETTEESSEAESEEDDATETWQEAESDVLDLVESLKQKLAQIHPGIGDQLTLARFVRFIEANSTCL
jgi:hypothetical protein